MAKHLSKAYADVLFHISTSWIYNCDSGCFCDVCNRQTFMHGPYLVIYQPHKTMKEYEDFVASVFIKKQSGKISAKEFRTFVEGPKLDIERELLRSYNEYLASSGNNWTHPNNDGTADKLLQIRKPMQLEDGAIKFSFEIRGATSGCCGDGWTPHLLVTKYLDEDYRGQVPEFEDEDWRENKLVYPATPATLV